MRIIRRTLVLWIITFLPSLAQEAIRRGDYEQAVNCLDAYHSFNPNSAITHLMLGWAYFKKGDATRALDAYSEAIRLEPNNPATYLERGRYYAMREDHAAAIRDCSRTLRLAPDNTTALHMRGSEYAETNKYAKALADYETVLRLEPKNANVRLALVNLYATCPDATLRNVRRADEEASRLLPRTASKRAYATLAAAHARKGELDKAITWQRKALACVDRLDKEENRRTMLVLELYQKRKRRAGKASSRNTTRTASPQEDGGP